MGGDEDEGQAGETGETVGKTEAPSVEPPKEVEAEAPPADQPQAEPEPQRQGETDA